MTMIEMRAAGDGEKGRGARGRSAEIGLRRWKRRWDGSWIGWRRG
jgi:hypothetical protein